MTFEHFRRHLSHDFPFLNGRLLLAVSGGLDSMVMAALFSEAGFEAGIAHCNFGLRGAESDEESRFVEHYAKNHDLPFHVQRFDTQAFAADFKLSIQSAARQLRYAWFDDIAADFNYDFILTAHHADDNLETFLMHLSRGTGIDGLTGIPPVNGKIIRPLLPFSRVEIEAYAREKGILWKEDSSNAEDKYLRNKVRHQIVPLLKELNPSFLSSFENTLVNLKQTASLADDASRIVYRKTVTEDAGKKRIDLIELLQLPNYQAYLHEWLAPLGFTAWADIYDLVKAEKGKAIVSGGFKLLKDRDSLMVVPMEIGTSDEVFEIEESVSETQNPVKLQFEKATQLSDTSNTAIFVDRNKLRYPLALRQPQPGDAFRPSGMGGRSKKLGKFLRDEKIAVDEKSRQWLLCSGEDIVWVIGRRPDERFKANETTQNIIKITFFP